MLTEPDSPPTRHANADAWAYNSRLGLVLFAVYLLFYGAFIGLSAFDQETMGKPSLGGANVATVYGLGLIVGAFVLAVVYMILCRSEVDDRPEMTEAEVAAKAVEEEGGA